MSSDSIKPLIFISYAHKDEPDPPEEPAQGKICWLSFVMKFLRPGGRRRARFDEALRRVRAARRQRRGRFDSRKRNPRALERAIAEIEPHRLWLGDLLRFARCRRASKIFNIRYLLYNKDISHTFFRVAEK